MPDPIPEGDPGSVAAVAALPVQAVSEGPAPAAALGYRLVFTNGTNEFRMGTPVPRPRRGCSIEAVCRPRWPAITPPTCSGAQVHGHRPLAADTHLTLDLVRIVAFPGVHLTLTAIDGPAERARHFPTHRPGACEAHPVQARVHLAYPDRDLGDRTETGKQS